MTNLLVLSDSHGGRDAIERILNKEAKNIDALIFLGDGLRDLEQALTRHPKLRTYAVAGNCDFGALEPLDGLAAFDNVVIFYTHGHMYGVKYDLDTLADAAAARLRRGRAAFIPELLDREHAPVHPPDQARKHRAVLIDIHVDGNIGFGVSFSHTATSDVLLPRSLLTRCAICCMINA